METRQRFQHGKEGIVDQLFWFDLGKRGGLIDLIDFRRSQFQGWWVGRHSLSRSCTAKSRETMVSTDPLAPPEVLEMREMRAFSRVFGDVSS